MPYTYNNLATGFRWKRGEILDAALHSKTLDGSAGAASLFCNALFCILEAEFRRSPNKKKAILMWEMFLSGNHVKTAPKHEKILIPKNAAWSTLLDMNLEGGGGVKAKDFQKIQNGMATVMGVYDNGQKLSSKHRKKTASTRKFGIIGGQASGQMFLPVVNAVKVTISKIGAMGLQNSVTAFMAKQISKNLKPIIDTIGKAGFNVDSLGIKKVSD